MLLSAFLLRYNPFVRLQFPI